MIGGQVLIIFVGGRAFNITPLNGPQWGISIVLGVLSIPWAMVIRLVPDEAVAGLIPWTVRRRYLPETIKQDIEAVRKAKARAKELLFIRSLRGGRVNTLRSMSEDYKAQSGLQSPTMMGAMAMVR